MNPLGKQLEAILRPKLPKAAEAGGKVLAEELAEGMKANTLSGRTYPSGNYVQPYSGSYKKYRKRQSLSTHPTTLRANKKRIERTKIETVNSQGGKIVFQNARERAGKSSKSATLGEVMYLHHTGMAKGGKFRQLFPYSEQHSSVPRPMLDKARKAIHEVLSGR
jgi:hypothetical protein